MAGFWAGFGVHLGCGEQGDRGGVQSKEGRLDPKNMTFDDIEIFMYMTEVGTVMDGKDDGRCRGNPHIPPHLNNLWWLAGGQPGVGSARNARDRATLRVFLMASDRVEDGARR